MKHMLCISTVVCVCKMRIEFGGSIFLLLPKVSKRKMEAFQRKCYIFWRHKHWTAPNEQHRRKSIHTFYPYLWRCENVIFFAFLFRSWWAYLFTNHVWYSMLCFYITLSWFRRYISFSRSYWVASMRGRSASLQAEL